MSQFDFGGDDVARAYEDVLVRHMFEPWAESLLEEVPDWQGRRVLDLATGTGVVARLLAGRVGPAGRVIAADLNPEMLAMARQRTEGLTVVEVLESPAHPLAVPDASVDLVVCQQGFQFFPDRQAAADEVFRVLRPGGRVLVSTWCPTEECEFWGWICDALAEVGELEIEALLRLPFDHMPPDELASIFVDAGFDHVLLGRRSAPLVLPNGAHDALLMAYATPIAPKLRELPEDRREAFHEAVERRVTAESEGQNILGNMAAHVVRATKGPTAAG